MKPADHLQASQILRDAAARAVTDAVMRKAAEIIAIHGRAESRVWFDGEEIHVLVYSPEDTAPTPPE